MTASKAEIRRERFERTVTYATGNYCRTDYRSPSVLTMTLALIRPLLISLKHNQVCRFGELLSGQEFCSKIGPIWSKDVWGQQIDAQSSPSLTVS